MTAHEFGLWTEETRRFGGQWKIDPVHCTMSDLIVYKHVRDGRGRYVMIHGNSVSVGHFTGAIPHIGEATFRSQANYDLAGRGDIAERKENAIRKVCGQGILDQLLTSA